MEDRNIESQVWQRVRASAEELPRNDLRQLQREAMELAAIYRNLMAQFAGRQQEQAQERIKAELAEISKHDPNIKEVKDLLAMENFTQFREYVNKGLSYKDAYFLANRESMAAAQAKAARQQAMSNARSKEHLNPTNVQGDGALSVPAEQMKMYRMMMPNATTAQIQAHYNAHMRGK